MILARHNVPATGGGAGGRRSVLERIQQPPSSAVATCRFWRVGHCNRHPCPFLHGEMPPALATATQGHHGRRPDVWSRLGPVHVHVQQQHQRLNRLNSLPKSSQVPALLLTKKRPLDAAAAAKGRTLPQLGPQPKRRAKVTDETPQSHQLQQQEVAPLPPAVQVTKQVQPEDDKDVGVCRSFLAGECGVGGNCSGLHQRFTGNCFSHLAELQGHTKEIVGITLPCNSNKLLTAYRDGAITIWDCDTTQSIQVLYSGCEINCVFSDGPWVFIGCRNAVQACNTQTWTHNIETLEVVTLPVPSGPVRALAVGDNILFAGLEDGSILSWKMNAESKSFEQAAVLLGHRGAVVSLIVGAKRLYSGSMDNTIRAWDILTLEYIDTLIGHSSVVTSLLCWHCFLLSCSLDHTIKAWGLEKNGYQLKYTFTQKHPAIALKGMCDDQGRPVLMCSYDDKTIRLYDLPTFNERGKIFSTEEVKVMHAGPSDIFFTGDGAGKVNMWKWSTVDKCSP